MVILFPSNETVLQKSEYEFAIVKEESCGPVAPLSDKALQVEDRMYMKVRSSPPILMPMWILSH